MHRGRSSIALALATLFACRDRATTPGSDNPNDPSEHPTEHPVDGHEKPPTHPVDAHPDYPVPGEDTDEIFLRGEPLRGPHVTNVTLPDRATLRFTEHSWCELDSSLLACSERRPREGKPSLSWNVGRANDRPILAEKLNPSGQVAESYLFDWDAAGKLTRLVLLDAHGQVVRSQSFNPPNDRYTERLLTGANGLDGCGAMQLKPNALAPRELTCLQWNGNPMRDENGVATTQLRFDGNGFLAEKTRFGLDKKPVLARDGVYRIVYQHTDSGRISSELYYDLAGKPAMSSVEGCAGRRYEYDDRDVLVREVCLGSDGEPARAKENVAATLFEKDDTGCITTRRYFDRDNKPTHVHGVYELRTLVNPFCEEIQQTCLGAEGERVSCGPEEPAEYEYERDAHGRVVSLKHRDPDGDPGHDSEFEVFELRDEYDAVGNKIGESCWGASGEPVDCGHVGYHATKMKLDDAGRTREVRYFDTDGAPTTNLGVGIRRYYYDNYDHIREIHDFDADGNEAEALGMAAQRRLYDSAHRLFGLLLVDKSGRPARYTGCFAGRDCPTRDWHAVRIFRGPNGHVTKNEYFDADGQLLLTLDCDTQRCWQ